MALRNCVSTLLSNLGAFGRRPTVLIADGSTTRGGLVDNKEVVRTFRERGSLNVELIGHEEKERLRRELVSAGLDKNVVSFAITGLTELSIGCAGANRNCLLLMSPEEKLLSVDDDTEMSFAAASQFQSQSVAGEDSVIRPSGESFTQVWVYHDRQSLQDSVQFAQMDFVGAHESVLGSKVGECGRVALTFSGLAGDCGWGTPSRYLFLSRESLARLTRSDDVYRDSITSRELVQVTTAVTLSRRADDLMTTAFAADNRFMLPPFIPVGRGEDLVFGRVLQNTQHDVWFGHLPHAIFHRPVGRRRFARGEIIRSAATTDLSSLICAIVDRCPTDGVDCCGSLRELGRSLSNICALSLDLFHAYIRECSTRLTQDRLHLLEERLRSAGPAAPSYVADMESYMERLREAGKREETGIPVELLYGREIDAALRCTQRVIAMYGKLLCAWPDMVEVANAWSDRVFEESRVR